ncbi:TetR/AcrR family transcriptional regulator [Streptomyces daliensis]|uniref:TetR/AcrR family transcriptional regulator n=1 Tax=Streptomyces daliensis TaxID=299421 RepID=A0A8T4INY8_9ACTN|nr:TetR/AcrR family transcriptional regulator [Streptomyces daliensis]
MAAVDTETSRQQILAAAHELFHAHGIRAVTMHHIRDASNVPLNRLYKTFPSKDDLVAAYLDHRDHSARDALTNALTAYDTPRAKIVGIFTWLHQFFQQPDFRGCVFTNAYGELGAQSPAAEIVLRHKTAIRVLLTDLARDANAPDPDTMGAQLQGLWDGAFLLAAMTRDPDHALHARATAQALLATITADH